MAEPEGTNRGQFLTLSTIGLGAMIGGVIGVPATAYILAPVVHEVTFEPVLLGEVDQFNAEKGFAPTAATYIEDTKQPDTSPGLACGALHGQERHHLGRGRCHVHRLLQPLHAPRLPGRRGSLCRISVPLSRRCLQHQGRPHGRPPIRPLDRFQWKIEKDKELWITQRWSVDFNSDGQIHYYEVKSPGQPVTLPRLGETGANILYPRVTYKYPSS